VLSYQGMKDSAYVKVISDPRFEFSQEVEEAHHAILKRLDKVTEKLSVSLGKLDECNAVVNNIQTQLNESKSPLREELIKSSNLINGIVKELKESATGSRPARQVGAWTSFQVTAQSKISEAHQALRARLYKPSPQDIQRVEIAEQLTNDFTAKVLTFLSKEWREYQGKVESAHLTWFKDKN